MCGGGPLLPPSALSVFVTEGPLLPSLLVSLTPIMQDWDFKNQLYRWGRSFGGPVFAAAGGGGG